MNQFRARGYIYVDHRQQSEVGLVRAYSRLSFTRDNADAVSPLFELAFVQVGGLTAGRFTNPYDILYYTNGWAPLGASGVGVKDTTSENGIAYTAALGNGLTATLALVDTTETRGPNATAVSYAGQSMPDVVGTTEWTQGWGSVKLSGAVHQVRYSNAAVDTDYGFAGAAGVKINLPMLAAGDFIGLSGSVAKGAPVYGGAITYRGGQEQFQTYDGYTVGNTGKLSDAWGVAGGLTHFWTKTVDTHVYSGYSAFEAGTVKANSWLVSQYTKWTPVSGLQLGIETTYREVGGRALRGARDKEDFSGRLRVQRDF